MNLGCLDNALPLLHGCTWAVDKWGTWPCEAGSQKQQLAAAWRRWPRPECAQQGRILTCRFFLYKYMYYVLDCVGPQGMPWPNWHTLWLRHCRWGAEIGNRNLRFFSFVLGYPIGLKSIFNDKIKILCSLECNTWPALCAKEGRAEPHHANQMGGLDNIVFNRQETSATRLMKKIKRKQPFGQQ